MISHPNHLKTNQDKESSCNDFSSFLVSFALYYCTPGRADLITTEKNTALSIFSFTMQNNWLQISLLISLFE